jgi:hypothetical protein
MLVGEGGLLGSLISQAKNAIERADVDPQGLRRELTDTVNRLIPGQALPWVRSGLFSSFRFRLQEF